MNQITIKPEEFIAMLESNKAEEYNINIVSGDLIINASTSDAISKEDILIENFIFNDHVYLYGRFLGTIEFKSCIFLKSLSLNGLQTRSFKLNEGSVKGDLIVGSETAIGNIEIIETRLENFYLGGSISKNNVLALINPDTNKYGKLICNPSRVKEIILDPDSLSIERVVTTDEITAWQFHLVGIPVYISRYKIDRMLPA